MLKTIIWISALMCCTTAFADQYVNGYTRQNGTYVQGYTRSSPDSTVTNNYSYQGNSNPYTGQTGTSQYPNDVTSPYYQGPNAQGESGHSGYGYQQYGSGR